MFSTNFSRTKYIKREGDNADRAKKSKEKPKKKTMRKSTWEFAPNIMNMQKITTT